MPMLKNVLGLDLGAHSIKAVELRQTLRGVEPEQLRVQPRADAAETHPPVALDEASEEPGEEAPDPGPEPLQQTLRRFLQLHHLPTEHVVCALDGGRLSSRRLEFPFRDRKRLTAAVPFEVESEVPFEPEDILIGWELVGGERTQGVVNACIAQRKNVAALLDELRGADCEPRVLEAEGFALANLTSVFDLPGTRLLMDLGHRKTTLCLLVEGMAVSSRTFAIGGLQLTEAIAAERGLSLEGAEEAKCEEGVFDSELQPTPGTRDVLDRITRELVRTLQSLDPVLGAAPSAALDEITLLGGTGRLHRLDEYIASQTGIPTTRLSLPPNAENAALLAGGDPMLFAPALALALRGTAQATTSMNFRQAEFAYRTDLRQFFSKDMRWTAAFAGVVVLLLGVSAATSISLDSARAKRLDAQVAALYVEAFPGQAVPGNPLAAMRNAGVEARDRADYLGVYGGNRSALDLLGELSRRVPSDLEVKFEEVSIDRRVVRIKVFAKSFEAADRLVTELAASPPFTQATIDGEVKASRKRQGKNFNVSIPLPVPGEEA